MDPDEELLRKADEAQQWAERSRSPAVKAGWLRIAHGWRSLLSKSSPASEPHDRAEAEGANGSR
jgi:hypothetical protein